MPDSRVMTCTLTFNDCVLNDFLNVVNYPDCCVRLVEVVILHHRNQMAALDIFNQEIPDIRNHEIV